MKNFIEEELEKISLAGLKRTFRIAEGPQGPSVRIDGREVLLFCGNDYLGLANNPEIKGAFIEAVERYGVGAGASRLVSGTSLPHVQLEERIKEFKGTEAALLFNSGYNANLGLITTLAERNTEIFSDRLNHASIVDACVLSRARVRRYPHSDASALEGFLKKSTAKKKIIITEGIFSMDGDIAPLREITGLLERYNALLIVDDAHATGVLGPGGRGTLAHLGIDKSPLIIEMGTFGKAFGTFGAYVAGSRGLVELLTSRARTFIYTTALPPALVAATVKAIDLVEAGEDLRETLRKNISSLKGRLSAAGLNVQSPTQIMPVIVGDARRTMEISNRLFEAGVFIQGIRPPTVPENTSRLRVTVSAAHTAADIDRAAGAIGEAFAASGEVSGEKL